MKKLLLLAVFGMAMSITSCGADDVEDAVNDLACENQTLASRTAVEGAITAYNASENTATCESLRQLIESYRDFECIPNDAFAAEYNALPTDCSSLNP